MGSSSSSSHVSDSYSSRELSTEISTEESPEEEKESLLDAEIYKYKYGKEPFLPSMFNFFNEIAFNHGKLLLYTNKGTILLHYGNFESDYFMHNWYKDGGLEFGFQSEEVFESCGTIVTEYENCNNMTVRSLILKVIEGHCYNKKNFSYLSNNCHDFARNCMNILQGEKV